MLEEVLNFGPHKFAAFAQRMSKIAKQPRFIFVKPPDFKVSLVLLAATVGVRVVSLRFGHVGNAPSALQQSGCNNGVFPEIQLFRKAPYLLQRSPAICPKRIREENRPEAQLGAVME